MCAYVYPTLNFQTCYPKHTYFSLGLIVLFLAKLNKCKYFINDPQNDTFTFYISLANRHQPTLPPRLQQERKKQAQSSPSLVPEKSDPAQKGSSKRYSSQRQRNVPEVPGFSEPPAVPPPEVSVPAPKLKEPAYFNPGAYGKCSKSSNTKK